MRLIDADELKDILSEEITRKFVRWDKTITVAEWETFIRDIIDNAPTVRHPNCDNCEDKAKQYSLGFQDGYLTGKERPQGEWLMESKLYGGFGDSVLAITCSMCKESFVYRGTTHNYCPNCGVSMKKGGAE